MDEVVDRENHAIAGRGVSWASPLGVEKDDKTLDAVYDIQAAASRHQTYAHIETIRWLPDGSGALPNDLRGSRALTPDTTSQRHQKLERLHAGRCPISRRAPQIRLLAYNRADCDVVVEPLTEMVDLRGSGARYRLSGPYPLSGEIRQPTGVRRNAQRSCRDDVSVWSGAGGHSVARRAADERDGSSCQ